MKRKGRQNTTPEKVHDRHTLPSSILISQRFTMPRPSNRNLCTCENPGSPGSEITKTKPFMKEINKRINAIMNKSMI